MSQMDSRNLHIRHRKGSTVSPLMSLFETLTGELLHQNPLIAASKFRTYDVENSLTSKPKGRHQSSPQKDDKNMQGNIGDLFVKCI